VAVANEAGILTEGKEREENKVGVLLKYHSQPQVNQANLYFAFLDFFI